jgi:hypothetical protein
MIHRHVLFARLVPISAGTRRYWRRLPVQGTGATLPRRSQAITVEEFVDLSDDEQR